MKKIAVLAAKRSPVGKIPGELNYLNETALLGKIFREVTKNLEHLKIDEAIVGSAFPIERDNLCRKAILFAGLSPEISGQTISKTCASSDEALAAAYYKIYSGHAKAMLVGGSEKVSNSPYTLHFMKQNIKKALKSDLPYFKDIKNHIMENDMTYINEMLSRKYKISRKKQDDFTCESIKKSQFAMQHNYYIKETVPIDYWAGDQNHSLKADELLLNEVIAEEIYGAKPMFLQDGVITQYNAAAMCDCAAAMVIMDYEEAKKNNTKPLVLIKDVVSVGIANEHKGLAMVEGINIILRRNNLVASDIDLFEINESFALQAILTEELLALDRQKVNVKGGNLALGYPIGATGLRMNISLIYEMKRRQVRLGISTVCAGGNMANVVIFENVV